ncbi:WG repeat-containing protein [Leptospira meyeri]|uniref:WG repeat-containing protein n=1 Tax=Leptospira meyeri TaxID=29508 RepID=UPI00223CA246|nr:WG repeat-containing protein [Leptospira meyeri]MCW7490950.1 WG repeat-containing protein [Leptospira meyeri]
MIKKLIILSICFNTISIFGKDLLEFRVKNKIGLIDSSGNVIIEPSYDSIELAPFKYSDLAFVYTKGGCGYINKNNLIIIKLEFFECKRFQGEYAIVIDRWECKNHKAIYRQSIIDKNGNILYSFDDRDLISYSEGFFVYNLEKERGCGYESYSKSSIGSYGFLDKNGKEVPKVKYEFILGFSDGLAIVNSKGKWGIIDSNFKVVFPIVHDNISPFYSGYSTIQLNNESATINSKLEIVIPFGDFFSIREFSDGLASACRKKIPKNLLKIECTNVIVDEKGTILFEETSDIKYIQHFYDGLAVASNKNGYQGLINKSFQWVVNPKYFLANSFQNGATQVYKTQDDYWKNRFSLIDKEGNVIWKHPDL